MGRFMKKTLTMTFFYLALCFPGNGIETAVAATSVSIDHIGGFFAPDTICVERPIFFYLRLTNETAVDLSHITNGFRIYSPDDVKWTAMIGDTVGDPGGTQFDSGLFINHFSISGSGADTVGFDGRADTGRGLIAGYNAIAYRVTIGPIALEHYGKQICIDSAWFPPAGEWLWSSKDSLYQPTWNGPYCYTIYRPPG